MRSKENVGGSRCDLATENLSLFPCVESLYDIVGVRRRVLQGGSGTR